jgi:hypothetical protein
MTVLEKVQEFATEGRRQESLKRPHLYHLESFGRYLFDQTKELGKGVTDSDLSSRLTSLDMDLYIFNSDLTGELKHDYDNDLKRYPAKWSNEYRKLSTIKNKFIQLYKDIEESKKGA